MSFDASPFKNNGDPKETPEELKQVHLSLDEFKSELISRGFEVSSENNNVYYHPIFPDFRFKILKTVVRVEKKIYSLRGGTWRLNESYLISRDLHLALFAADKITKRPTLSVDDFKSGLISRGYVENLGNANIYHHPNFPDHRFVIGPDVRLEREAISQWKEKEWQLDSYYSLSGELQIALTAADLMFIKPVNVQKRRELLAIPMQIILIVLGSIFLFSGILLLFVPKTVAPNFLDTLFIILGLLFLPTILRRSIDYRKFQRSSLVTSATVVGKDFKIDRDPDGPDQKMYFLVVQFEALGLESSENQVTLRAKVKEQLYLSSMTGSTVMLEYAAKDPRIAQLEGEQ